MPPSVEIQTEALGLSAAEVEQLITLGLEQDLLNGVPWLDRIHSSSMPGLSVIDLTFQPGTDGSDFWFHGEAAGSLPMVMVP